LLKLANSSRTGSRASIFTFMKAAEAQRRQRRKRCLLCGSAALMKVKMVALLTVSEEFASFNKRWQS
jgi:hypothetical protein